MTRPLRNQKPAIAPRSSRGFFSGLGPGLITTVLDLQHLRTFVVMVAVGNFTRAAKELDCSQSTVTLHITTLEHEVRALLFERDRIAKANTLTQLDSGSTNILFDY